MARPIDKTYTFSWRSEMEIAIDAEHSIPSDAKQAIKDFVIENLQDINNFSADLQDFPISDVIENYWPVVAEILKVARHNKGVTPFAAPPLHKTRIDNSAK